MHSSISSSNQRLPHLAWLPILLGAVLALAVFMAAMEWQLAVKGFRPTIMDSEALWQEERVRARKLGERALIIVGASRVQLGLNLEVLRQLTGLEPVQLAIDGMSPLPVLEGLARDPDIKGVVMVDYYDSMLGSEDGLNHARIYETRFEKSLASSLLSDDAWIGNDLNYDRIENDLSRRWRRMFRSYADGAQPLMSLLIRIFGDATPQYLLTLPDRSRLADYQQVAMPDFYYRRVARSLAEATDEDIKHWLESRIRQLSRVDETVMMSQAQLNHLESLVHAIQDRGGKVIFVLMPSSGMVRDVERRRYPRSRFWDRLVAQTSAHVVHFEDIAGLRDFVCPDGSHLDYRDQIRFTTALMTAAGLARR